MKKIESYDIAIIGGGVCGASIARELSRYRVKVVLLKKRRMYVSVYQKQIQG